MSQTETAEQSLNGKPFALFLMAFGGAMIIVALMQRQETQTRRPTLSESSQEGSQELASTQDIVEKYRRQVGDKLNRDRISVQHKNLADMRVRNAVTQKPQYDTVLNGVPLSGEKTFAIERKTFEKRDLTSEIQARLAFEENLQKWEDEARAAYVAEFLANAEAMGYRVQIDANYNVTYESVEARRPQSLNLTLPSFIRAPLCKLPR